MQEILVFLHQLAREAGQVMLKHLSESVSVYPKPDGTVVTQVDLEVSALVCERIQTHYPDLHLLTEETKGQAICGERGLIIDELDGTNSYLKRRNGFAFQAAYYENHGDIQVAVIYDPVRDLMISATKGQGVSLHAQGVTQQIAAPPLRRWQYLRFANHRDYLPKTFQRVYKRLGVAPEQIVATGCISNKVIAFVLGQVDALVALNRFIPAWDWAPGQLILDELGYALTHLDGQSLDLKGLPGYTPFGYLVAPKPHLPRLIQELDWVQQKVSSRLTHRPDRHRAVGTRPRR